MTECTNSVSQPPIDAVITWVDGNDPKLAEKRARYSERKSRGSYFSIHPTRFASVNEIKYCVLSIFRFAPFVRYVFIVTDGQDPNLLDDVRCHFPERVDSIRIVDHKEIFEGYEQYLPTFNSRSIENMIWRIKGLSNRFIFFNDDFFLIRETNPSDWFVDAYPVIRAKWRPMPVFRLAWNVIKKVFNRFLVFNPYYEPRASFHIGQWNAARILGQRCRYLVYAHTPHAVNRSTVEEFFSRDRALIERSVAYRFRNYQQAPFIALSYHLQWINGNRLLKDIGLEYLRPFRRSRNYIHRKIRSCEKNSNVKFMCVQSLDLCSKDEQNKLFRWLDSIMGLV